MSQVAGILTADPELRRAYAAAVTPRLPLLSGQVCSGWKCGNAEVGFAVAPRAPLTCTAAVAPNTAGGFVLGRWSEAAGTDGDVSQADRLVAGCAAAGGQAVAAGAGYGMACYVEPAGDEVWLGADVLGMFPLYYHATPERLIFATSPALVAADPWFDASLDVQGLVGNLLTMHMVGGRTLWRGVRRLTPGHALRWRRGEAAAREIPVRVLTPGDKYFGESPDKHVDRSDEALDRAVRLDACGADAGGGNALLLSGGLDSRLLAAYLRKAVSGPVDGITCGRSGDLEMDIAARVARRLDWPQHAVEPDPERFVEVAERHLTFQQLGNGFNDMAFWYAAETAAGRGAARVFTGVMGDTVMGGEHIPWGYDPERRAYSYDTLFARINRYGFTPGEIRRLVRPEALEDGALDAATTELRDTYGRCAGRPFQKVWLFDLLHRNRFHIAAIPWEVSAGAWAAPAFCTAELLELAANLPADTFPQRRVQVELLCRHAPDLAALPLDRNSRTNLAPVRYASDWQRRWDEKVMGKYRRAMRKWHDRRGVETRYYYRVYDIKNAAWQAVRHAAEPHRKTVEGILDPATLRELLPPPETEIRLGDGIVDAARVKTLLGFMLWAGKNL